MDRACFSIAGSRGNISTCLGLRFETWKKIDKINIGASFTGRKYGNWNWVARATIWARWRSWLFLNGGVNAVGFGGSGRFGCWVLSLIVLRSVTGSRSEFFSSWWASTCLDKKRMACGDSSSLSPGTGANGCYSLTGQVSSVAPSLSGSGSSSPSQCFPIAAKSVEIFLCSATRALILALDLLFENIFVKTSSGSRLRYDKCRKTAKRSSWNSDKRMCNVIWR